MRWQIRILGLALIAVAVFMAGCESESPTPTASSSPLATPETGTTDFSVSTPSEEAGAPVPTGEDSPAVEAVPLEGATFSIDEPLREGDTQVSGEGPSDIPILIADLTLLGESLGRGKIGADGRFVIPVTPGLILNHRIGILLDTETTEIQYTEELLAQLEALRGDGAMSIPRIGTTYDAASVQP